MKIAQKKSGQTLLEYSILIVIIIGALVATGVYVKRGIQGRWKNAVDDLGEQYDPTVMTTDITHTVRGSSNTQIFGQRGTYNGVEGIWTIRTDTSNMTEQKSGESTAATY